MCAVQVGCPSLAHVYSSGMPMWGPTPTQLKAHSKPMPSLSPCNPRKSHVGPTWTCWLGALSPAFETVHAAFFFPLSSALFTVFFSLLWCHGVRTGFHSSFKHFFFISLCSSSIICSVSGLVSLPLTVFTATAVGDSLGLEWLSTVVVAAWHSVWNSCTYGILAAVDVFHFSNL